MKARRRTSCGFSLLEVVVAFAIAALSLVVLSQVFGLGARNLAVSRDYSRAVNFADALLVQYGDGLSVSPQLITDSNADFRWQITIEPYIDDESHLPDAPAPIPAASESAIGLARIQVDLDWRRNGAARSLSVASLRLMKAGADETR